MRNLELPGRSPAHAMHAMAATSHTLSTQAAVSILKDGGNAMDAAIAACAVQCVVEPQSTGLGGDNFCLYAKAGSPEIVAFNGSGKAPTGATCAYFADRGVAAIDRQSPHAVVVPGAVDAWCQLNADHGRLPLKTLLVPAIGYARDGYPIASRVSVDWAQAAGLIMAEPNMARIFMPGGVPPKVGSIHRQPALAETLEAIAEGGRNAFYSGENARSMVDYLQGLGGLHTLEDFASVNGDYVQPVSAEFRGHTVWQCPPNGQGVIALLLLNIMSGVATTGSPMSAMRIHAEIEACRLAYTARNLYVGDPAFSEIDVDTLLSPEYASRLRAQIDPAKARAPMPDPGLVRHDDTVYIAIVDADGNACSFINTLFSSFGAGLCDANTGVVFTNRAQGFSLDPESPNRIEPGKRPLHTIIPGMVTRNGKVTMSYGVMGGQYQAMGHMQFLTRLFDYEMDVQEAIDAPRFMADPDNGEVEMEETVPDAVREKLGAAGHDVSLAEKPIGGAQAILIDPDTGALTGGSDPRKDGCAIGY